MEVTARSTFTDFVSTPNLKSGGSIRDAQHRIAAAFDREYSCITADNPSLRAIAYKLRYDVYCVERKYEESNNGTTGIETDEFDSHAPHKLLFHRQSGQYAGVVRLILPAETTRTHYLPFTHLVPKAITATAAIPSSHTAEVSRFAITRQFREHLLSGTGNSISSEPRPSSGALLCYLSVGLMRAVVEMAAEHGMSHLCAIMEPALLRLLSRLGVHFEPIGPRVEHHGVRQPCFADLDCLLARTWVERRDIWEILTDRGRTWPLLSNKFQLVYERGLRRA